MKPCIYIIGALKNRDPIIEFAKKLRELGFDVFDDWLAPGPHADQEWEYYEKKKGSTFRQALKNWASKNIVRFDQHHLKRAQYVILMLPAGKSGHLELGYAARWHEQKAFVLFDGEPGPNDRWDQMYGLVFEHGGDVFFSQPEAMSYFEEELNRATRSA